MTWTPLRKPRKEHAESTINTKNKLLGELLSNKDKSWTSEDDDLLLEGFLVHKWRHQSTRECFLSEMGRSEHSIGTRLRKLGMNYEETKRYAPRQRTNRTGTPFTEDDLYLIREALNDRGRSNSAHHPAHIAKILGRDVGEVAAWLKRQADGAPGLLNGPLKGENETDRVARLVRTVLKELLKHVAEAL